jgi:hypothetical protein
MNSFQDANFTKFITIVGILNCFLQIQGQEGARIIILDKPWYLEIAPDYFLIENLAGSIFSILL